MTQKPNMKLWGSSYLPENKQFCRYLSMLSIIIIMLIIPAAADTITVCAENCNYTSIQAAINATEPGDTILVKSGTYPENVEVDIQVILNGIDTGGGKPVVDGSGTGNVITISAADVTVDGFVITNSGESLDYAGIYVSSDGNIISNNTIHDNEIGVNIYSSRFNNLTSNSVMDNTRGIYLIDSDHNTLRDNLMSSNDYNFGVLAWDVVAMGGEDSTDSGEPVISASGELPLGNDIDTSNLVDGKPIYYLIGESDIVIDSSSNACMVYCIDCENIMIKDLEFSNNYAGVFLYRTAHSTIQNNIINDNDRYGMVIFASSNNSVFGNTISGSGWDGVYMTSSADNNISNNVISSNNNGIDIQISVNNIFSKNTIRENENFGAKFEYSVRNNTIYHNNFEDNNQHAFDDAGENAWNLEYPEGGNYWEEHESPDEKSGAQQDMPGGDGIADSPYVLTGIEDRYPFSYPDGWTFHRKMYFHKSLNTTANSVKYIDAQDEVDTMLEFVTSDDVSGSAMSVMHSDKIFPGINQSPGNNVLKYVSINADDKLNEKLQWVKLKIYYDQTELKSSGLDESSLHIIYYNETAPALERVQLSGVDRVDAAGYAGYVWANVSHFSYYGIGGSPVPASAPPIKTAAGNGGGGGGGGASGEAFENIRITETQRESVFKDQKVSYHFEMEGNIVEYINFTTLTSSGTIAARVEILNHTSTLADSAPPDVVYKHLNLWVGNLGWANSKNIAAPTVTFKVEKSWISENDIDENTITMNRFDDGEWKNLQTARLQADADFIYFNAATPGFSPFAVTGKEARRAGGEGISALPKTGSDESPGQSQTVEEEIPGFGLFAGMSILLILWQLFKRAGFQEAVK